MSLYSCSSQIDGTAIRLYGMDHRSLPGAIELVANGNNFKNTDAGHLFNTYFKTPNLMLTRMVITRDGLLGMGYNINLSTLNPADRLTVNNNVCITADDDVAARNLRARTDLGLLNLLSGSDANDGVGIQLLGMHCGNPYNGGIRFFAAQNPVDSKGVRAFDFTMSAGGQSGLFNSYFIIDKSGNSRFGPGDPFGERLKVDGDLYLYDAGQRQMHNIHPRSTTNGGINLQAGNDNSDGAAVSVYGAYHSANPGQVVFTANTASNPTGKGFRFATGSNNAFTDKMILNKDGLLQLSNDVQFNLVNATAPRNIYGETNTAALFLESGSAQSNGTSLELYGANNITTPGEMHFVVNVTSVTQGYRFYNYDPATNGFNELVNIHKDGKMIIGNPVLTSSPGAYKLYVADGIMTERVNVALKNTSAWSDYVFATDYQLMSLEKVAAYIQDYKHLPGVPSANEVVAKGVDMVNMDATLLKKIEELTLYTIELQKLLEKQAEAIAKLQKR